MRLKHRVEEHDDLVLHYGKHVSEAFSTMACECGQLHRHLGASKVFECVALHCARHGPGVRFHRDRRSAREIYVLNTFRVHKPARAAVAALLGLSTSAV